MVLRLFKECLGSLSTTITDLVTVVQEQRGPVEQAFEQVSFEGVMADVPGNLRPQFAAAQAHRTSDFSALSELPCVSGSLRTILLNLLGNALKYRPPGTRCTCGCAPAKQPSRPCSKSPTTAWASTWRATAPS